MRQLALAVGLLTVLILAFANEPQKKEPTPNEAPPVIDNPILFLIRDRAVQKELKLRDDQKKSLRRLLDDELDGPLWALRDAGHDQGGERRRQLEAKAQAALKVVLGLERLKRLDQLALQYQGLDALLIPEMAQKFKLSTEQRKKIRRIYDDTRQAVEELKKQAVAGERKDAADEINNLRTEGRDKLVDSLTEEQKKQWNEMLGKEFDLTQINWPGPIRAPELAAATAWINSGPLTLANLRGRVVVLHFWTLGSMSCIRNHPEYSGWHEKYSGKGLTVIGIHIPETEGEKNLDAVREKVKEHDISYPVAVDNDRKTWDAWTNSVWPSVYLIDKQGYIRSWWYGELNLKGAEGEKIMRDKIEELLGEKD